MLIISCTFVNVKDKLGKEENAKGEDFDIGKERQTVKILPVAAEIIGKEASGVCPMDERGDALMNGIHSLFGETTPEKAEVQRSATTAAKEAAFATHLAKEGETTDISVSVSEGAVGNVEEDLCYGDVSKEKVQGKEEEGEEDEKELSDSAQKLTEDDYEGLLKEGILPEELTASELEKAIEHIRLGRERKAMQLEVRHENNVKKREEALATAKRALKGNPAAEFIAEKLLKVGAPVTQSVVHQVYEAVEFAGNVSDMTESMQYYLVKNGKEPTIENVYMAKYCAGSVKATPVTDKVWQSLSVSVNQVLVRAGMEINEENLAAARWLTERGLPVNDETLHRMEILSDVKKRTPEEIAELAAGAILDGKKPIQASLTTMTLSDAEAFVEDIRSFRPETVERAYIEKAAQNLRAEGENLNADSLGRAMKKTAKEDVTYRELSSAEDALKKEEKLNPLEQAVSDRLSGFSMDFDINVVRSKRRLEEIRLKMTAESAFRLERQGIRLDTSGLSKMVDGLKSLENTYFRYYTDDKSVAGQKGMGELFQKTMQYLDSLSNSPDYTLGVTFEKRSQITLEKLTNEGNTLAGRLQRAGQSYETLATKPQAAYGDSIKEAFGQNARLLKDIGMEASPENLRAVRILAYNSIELNEENMNAIKAYDRRVSNLIDNMHPAAALRLIREGINPLTETVDALSARVDEIRREENLEGASEKYARYLFKLERSSSITPEEKTAYIGMFRLFNQLEQTDGAAIGAVMESGKQLTLGNLLSAMRTAKSGGLNLTADEKTAGLKPGAGAASKIDAQILSGIKIPGKLADISVNDGYEIYKENTALSEEETKAAVQNLRTNAADTTQAPEFLKNLGLVVTANNVEAAKEFLAESGQMYQSLSGLIKKFRKDKEDSDTQSILKAGKAINTESLFDMEVAEGFFRNLKKEVRNLEDEMTQAEPEALDFKALKQIKMGVKLRGECADKQCFDFPVETSEGVRSMRVTLRSLGEDEVGGSATVKIPLVKLGTVQADLHMEDDRIFCYVSSDSREGTELLEHSKRELTERLFDLGVTDALVYCGSDAGFAGGATGIPGMDTEGDVTESQERGQADTKQLLEASKAVFVHIMQLERA